jgi:flagellar biogenesis protein FliO
MTMLKAETREDSLGEQNNGLAPWILNRVREVFRGKFAGLGRSRCKRRMELIERLDLGGKRQLMLVVCDGHRFLVGGSDSIHSITEMRGAPELRLEDTASHSDSAKSLPPFPTHGSAQQMRCDS